MLYEFGAIGQLWPVSNFTLIWLDLENNERR